MEPGRRPAPDRRHSARHSTGGFLGGRPARVVAAGLTVSIGIVGGVVVAERAGDAPTQAQVLPPVVTASPSASASASPSVSAVPDVRRATPAPQVSAPPSVEVPGVETPAPATSASQDGGTADGGTPAPVPAVPDATHREPPAEEPPAEEPPVGETSADEPPADEPPAAEPVEEAGRVLLRTTVQVPPEWQVPTGAVSVDVPLPAPVTVTAEVSAPEPGRLDVALVLTPGPRHVVADPAPEATAEVPADGPPTTDRVARHRQD